jgi:hypothetical protein
LFTTRPPRKSTWATTLTKLQALKIFGDTQTLLLFFYYYFDWKVAFEKERLFYNLSSVRFWNIQLFTDKRTQIGIYILMTWNKCRFTIDMIHIFIMPSAMFYKAASA